jgi:hypothetical protein
VPITLPPWIKTNRNIQAAHRRQAMHGPRAFGNVEKALTL